MRLDDFDNRRIQPHILGPFAPVRFLASSCCVISENFSIQSEQTGLDVTVNALVTVCWSYPPYAGMCASHREVSMAGNSLMDIGLSLTAVMNSSSPGMNASEKGAIAVYKLRACMRCM